MCHDVMAVCDRSRDGRVSYPEFVLFIGQREVELREAFSRIDVDRSGQLTSKEIRRALSELDIAASDEGVRALVERMDTDSSGEASSKPRASLLEEGQERVGGHGGGNPVGQLCSRAAVLKLSTP